jgi:hypothetical protein
MGIACVAVRFKGVVYCISIDSIPKPEHSSLFRLLPADWSERALEYGFLTSTGDFLNRVEALRVAKESGQISPNHPSRELNSMMLYSR